MAAHGWRKSPSVEAWLFEEGHAFDFYQAVSLLEQMRPDAAPIGEGSDPSTEAVRFSSTIGLAFPETDVERVTSPHREDEPAKMSVHFMGLAGALGPLPTPFVELVYRRSTRGDHGPREFLDIFNHRLISFAYRIRKLHRIGLGAVSPDKDAAAKMLYSLLGMGTPGLLGRLAFPDRSLLSHAGNLSAEARSLEGLVAMLRSHFKVSIEALPLTGGFHQIESEDRTAIGRSGKNRTLGRDAGLGDRFWDQEASFELRVGPMKFETFERFLPHGDALAPLCAMVRFYVGERFQFGVVLVLAKGEAPGCVIGRRAAAFLGQTAWLGRSKEASGDELLVRLSRAAIKQALTGKPAPDPRAGRPPPPPPRKPPQRPPAAPPQARPPARPPPVPPVLKKLGT